MHKPIAMFTASAAIPTNKFFQICRAPDDEGAGGSEPGFDFAAPTEALSVDKGAQILADSLKSDRERASNGQFAKKPDQGQISDDPENKVVDLKTGKPPVAEEQPKAEAEEDEDPEFEIPGEEGKEPTRRKLSELWDRFDKASELEKEVETLREQSSRTPAEYTTAVQEAVNKRGQYIKGLEYVSRLFNPQAPNVAMLDPNHPNYDPDGYRAAYAQFENSKKAVEQIRAEHEALTKEQNEQNETLFKSYLAGERQSLYKAWPEAKTPEVARQVEAELKKTYGFTDKEISNTTDHRLWLVVRDALELRALKAKQAEAVKVVRQKPKLVKGAARTTTDPKAANRSQAMRSLAQSGSVHDAAKALKGLI